MTRAALVFFNQQRQRGEDSALRELLGRALPGDLTALAAFDALSEDLITELSNDFLAT